MLFGKNNLSKYKDVKSFEEELLSIRLGVVNFLITIFLVISLAALVFFSYSFFTISDFVNERRIIIFLVIIAYIIIFYLALRSLNKNNYRLIVRLILAQFSIALILLSLLAGTYSPMIFPILISGILTTSIVLSFKSAQMYTFIMFLILLVVMILHNLKIMTFVPESTSSDLVNTLTVFFFIAVVLQIARIGYLQIEYSYTKALTYSKKLERMNEELDMKVKERTELLKENFDKQIESMYTSAVIGNITRPLLHDLATPISVLEGVFNLVDKKKSYDKVLFQAGKESIKQIKTLIIESRELMRGNDANSIFDVTEHIIKVKKILINELRVNNIDIIVKGKKNIMVEGIVSLFERIVVNIVVNAIEELKNREENRQIKINVTPVDKKVTIEIMDNGRGIPKEFLKKIFQDDFSLKNSYFNLGLGLNFVKSTIENKFGGKIKIDSELGSYTKFIIVLRKLKVPRKKTKKNS